MKRTKFLLAHVIIAAIGASGVAAQSSSEQLALASQLRTNQEELQQYSWKSQYTYKVDDVQRRVEEYTFKFFTDGTLQKMQISSQVAKEKIRGTDGKKLSKKQREAAYEFVMEVKSQLDSYLNPLFSHKAITKGTATTSDDILTIRSKDVVSRGDSVEIHFSSPNHLPLSASIQTQVEGSPVSLEIEFVTPEIGPSYPNHSVTTASWNGLRLEITAEYSDYKRTRH